MSDTLQETRKHYIADKLYKVLKEHSTNNSKSRDHAMDVTETPTAYELSSQSRHHLTPCET